MSLALMFFVLAAGFWMLAWLSAVSRDTYEQRDHVVDEMSAIPAAWRRRK